jgi:hypothetical protein
MPGIEMAAFAVTVALLVTPLPEFLWNLATKRRRDREYQEYLKRIHGSE